MGETERDIDEEAGVHYQRLAVNSCLGQRANVVLSMAISSNHKPSTQTYIASTCSSLPLNVIKLIMSIIQLSQVAAQSILHMCKIVHIVRHCPIHSRHAGFFLQGKAGSLNQSRRKMVEKTKKTFLPLCVGQDVGEGLLKILFTAPKTLVDLQVYFILRNVHSIFSMGATIQEFL